MGILMDRQVLCTLDTFCLSPLSHLQVMWTLGPALGLLITRASYKRFRDRVSGDHVASKLCETLGVRQASYGYDQSRCQGAALRLSPSL